MRAYRRAGGDRPRDAEDRKRRRARLLARVAVLRGKLPGGPCEECGDPQAQNHHDDYDKPLDVRRLCHPCHRLTHAALDHLPGPTLEILTREEHAQLTRR